MSTEQTPNDVLANGRADAERLGLEVVPIGPPVVIRTLTEHFDGHGLNDSITLTSDEPDKSGAAHCYQATIEAAPVLVIQFQKGPRNEPASIPGATEASVIAVLIDRLRGFQAGPYACRENAIILTKLEECLMWTRARADARARRGVLGQWIK